MKRLGIPAVVMGLLPVLLGTTTVLGAPGARAAIGTRLTGIQPCTCSYFGASVATTGSVTAVGMPGADDGAGRVDIFDLSGTAWNEVAVLSGNDTAPSDNFGWSVALSGSTLVVGAPRHGSGRAYVFDGSGSTWTQVAELDGLDSSTGDWLGGAVALSADGSVIVGAPAHAGNTGSAYVFDAPGGSWEQVAELSGDGRGGGMFGFATAASGTTALIGEPGQNGSHTGSSFVFAESAGTWARSAALKPADPKAASNFGFSVAVTDTAAAVGAWQTSKGGAYVFSNTSGSWAQTGRLQATDPVGGDDLGASVAIHGSDVLVGGVIANGNDGAIYDFSPSQGSWALIQTVAPRDMPAPSTRADP